MDSEIVLGPPGTGKTTYLMKCLNEMVDAGYKPSDIGFFSFTKSAAKEAVSRETEKLKGVTISTFHSLAYRAAGVSREQVVNDIKLREFSELVGYTVADRNYDIYATQAPDKGELLYSLHQLEVANMGRTARHAEVNDNEYKYFCETFKAWKSSNGFIDFNDMLVRLLGILERDDHQAPRFRVLIVDEAQDLSMLQLEIVKRLAFNMDGSDRCEVLRLAGDDDQSLYEWAGANTYLWAGDLDDPQKVIRVLEQSYRVPALVHDIALGVAGTIGRRIEKTYRPRAEPGEVVRVDDPRHISADPAVDTLVLYRNHLLKQGVEEYLRESLLPYAMIDGSGSWFTGRQAHAVRAWLAVLDGHPITVKQRDLLVNMCGIRAAKSEFLSCDYHRIIDGKRNSWRRYLDIGDNMADYIEAMSGTSHFDKKPKIRLGTIHSSKGMEADTVILINGMGHRTSEESFGKDSEARVWYVGLTRAKHKLVIVDGENPYPGI